jgi:hypothetical protein
MVSLSRNAKGDEITQIVTESISNSVLSAAIQLAIAIKLLALIRTEAEGLRHRRARFASVAVAAEFVLQNFASGLGSRGELCPEVAGVTKAVLLAASSFITAVTGTTATLRIGLARSGSPPARAASNIG